MMLSALHKSLAPRPTTRSRRVLHLIDAENLLGGADCSFAAARQGRTAYEAVAPLGDVNQMILSTSHHAARSAWFAWPGDVRRLIRSGPDGADTALLDVIAAEGLADRFGHVVIGSGDGIFALPAARLQAEGCSVTVVAHQSALSRRLRLAVRDIRFMQTERAILSVSRSVA